MLSRSFTVELFRPQPMHTYSATKTLFTKLAHSSVMKLNENSMAKLFDLMVMGIKYQFLSTVYPEEIYHVTLTHLEGMKTIIAGTNAEEHVQGCINSFVSMCKDFNAFDFMIIKQQLMSFLQDRHIKVSLFIQEKIQSLDGTININFTGKGPIYG